MGGGASFFILIVFFTMFVRLYFVFYERFPYYSNTDLFYRFYICLILFLIRNPQVPIRALSTLYINKLFLFVNIHNTVYTICTQKKKRYCTCCNQKQNKIQRTKTQQLFQPKPKLIEQTKTNETLQYE